MEKKFFGTLLNPLEILNISPVWSCGYDLLTKVTPSVFRRDYASRKWKSAIGQQQKGYSVLTSRKVVSVKSFSHPGGISFVKAQIKKSFGE